MYKLIYLMCFVFVFGLFFTDSVDAQDSSLVGWWKFDEGIGDLAIDSSGNGYDGAIEGDPVWAAGIIGQALEFDGVDDLVLIPRMIDTDFTLMAWIKTDKPGDAGEGEFTSAQGGDGLFWADVLGGASDNDFQWALVDRQLIFAAGNSDTGYSEQSVVTGDWIHIALTRDADSGDVSMYIDGGLDTTATLENTNPLTQNPNITLGANTMSFHYFAGLMDDARIYNRVLTPEEIRIIVRDVISFSSNPNPSDGITYVPRDTDLSWKSGEFANTHDIYFGTVLEDVENASRSNQLGVLEVQGHNTNTYDPGRLEFNQTYYWRVDEVNAPPSTTIFKGDVWSFTVEPVLYAVPSEDITATASSQFSDDQNPQNTVNRAGLDIEDLHSKSTSGMWLSGSGEPGSAWIQFDFDKVYNIYEMLVWNYNGQLFLSGYGIREAAVQYSTDGSTWTTIEGVPEFAKATGADGYAANTTVDFGGVIIKSVRITANSNWGTSLFDRYGLSEVQFLSLPLDARLPNPKNGARNVTLDTNLSWLPGREAVQHKIFFDSEEQIVIDDTTPVATVNQANYGPLSLGLGSTYYWRVDEVNNAASPSTWRGSIWSFTTEEYLLVDGFEDYNDVEPFTVYLTWVDGYLDTTNGSTTGYITGSALERDIIHRGAQSVPIFYDNTSASISEVTASTDDLGIGRDWAALSPKVLSLWFYGDPNNATTEQMYVKLDDKKVVYDEDPNNLIQETWLQWSIDLSEFGADLSNVSEMTIGFERTVATGGTGMVFIDDIQLYNPVDEQALLEQ